MRRRVSLLGAWLVAALILQGGESADVHGRTQSAHTEATGVVAARSDVDSSPDDRTTRAVQTLSYLSGLSTSVDLSDEAGRMDIDFEQGFVYVAIQTTNEVRALSFNKDTYALRQLGRARSRRSLRGPVAIATKRYGSKTYGFVACVGNGKFGISGGGRFGVVDLTDPTRPRVVNSITTRSIPGRRDQLYGVSNVAVRDNLAYVTSYISEALVIFDITIPNRPRFRGLVNVRRGRPTIGERDPGGGSALNGAFSVTLQGSTAWIAAAEVEKLTQVRIGNPSSPSIGSSFSFNPRKQVLFLRQPVDTAICANQPEIIYVLENGKEGKAVAAIDVSTTRFRQIARYQNRTLLTGVLSLICVNEQLLLTSAGNGAVVVLSPALAGNDIELLQVFQDSRLRTAVNLVAGPSGAGPDNSTVIGVLSQNRVNFLQFGG